MTHGLATIVVVGDTDHGNGGHHQRGNIRALQGVTHGQRIHNRGQHTHMVAGHTIHAGRRERRAAKQVAATDNQTDLDADANQLADFQGHAVEHLGIDAEVLGPHQGLAA